MAQTLFDKIWNDHIVSRSSGFPDTLYIDTHFINKATSPEAFEALRKRDIPVFRTKQTVVLNEKEFSIPNPVSDLIRFQLGLFNKNCSDFGIELATQKRSYDSKILASPGQTVVCDRNNTNNLGAFGVIAIGINQEQVEQVLASQCLLMQKPKTMKIEVNGKLRKGLGPKDINHYLISEISSTGARGYFIEFGGDTILSLDMEGRIAICNMSREIGAEGGIIAPDELTFDYLKERGIAPETGLDEVHPDSRKNLFSDETSVFDEVLEFDAEDIRPGTYVIGISKLLSSEPFNQGPVLYESAGIFQGYNDTEYILSQKEFIEEFERTQAYKTFNGVNPL
jgi:3-isopropylmalate/(R)-2-methylmalate dehydratase large subunit